ncbi:MAG TPA: bifunctional hydroxymethylpyrimidine kinase/phosphomethylpyrimidine kinase [Selenomonadales bacterium]|nr:bifunctional hydroxymethylpyrimidine kinase/phosphomethylpyrimidine kinase [Selenomonadales bacterium]
MKTALTIAGSDSGGGAGIQADLKTFAALGVFGMSAITAITAQNTCGVTNIRELDGEIITDQIDAVFSDIPVHAVKVGMLSSAAITEAVARALTRHKASNLVVDPVMVAKSGSRLLKPEAIEALKRHLFPLAAVVTPNLHEAAEIVGFPVADRAAMERAAAAIKAMGPRYVVVKGGHLPGDACDLLYDGREFTVFANERIDTIHTHGTGCTFSSAIAAGLAKGLPVKAAVGEAKKFITLAIQHGFSLGKGVGPTHHFYELYRRADLYQD